MRRLEIGEELEGLSFLGWEKSRSTNPGTTCTHHPTKESAVWLTMHRFIRLGELMGKGESSYRASPLFVGFIWGPFVHSVGRMMLVVLYCGGIAQQCPFGWAVSSGLRN